METKWQNFIITILQTLWINGSRHWTSMVGNIKKEQKPDQTGIWSSFWIPLAIYRKYRRQSNIRNSIMVLQTAEYRLWENVFVLSQINYKQWKEWRKPIHLKKDLKGRSSFLKMGRLNIPWQGMYTWIKNHQKPQVGDFWFFCFLVFYYVSHNTVCH